MKRARWVLLFALVLPITAGLVYGIDAKWKGKTLSVKEVEKRWGHDRFDEKKFQSGDSTVRAKMAASILAERLFMKQPVAEVEKKLGRPDGYFESEKIPAYLVEDGRVTHRPSWQLVFYPDETGKVSDIFVQENSSELPYRRKILN